MTGYNPALRDEMLAVTPGMRAYAIPLTSNVDAVVAC
jgi:hypothetical protein